MMVKKSSQKLNIRACFSYVIALESWPLSIKYLYCSLFILFVFFTGCGKSKPAEKANEQVLYTTPGGKINTLDPALCADLTSSNMVGVLYDTLLQYSYLKRPYVLEPAMLKEMPKSDERMMKYHFTLRDDLYFQYDKCFGQNSEGSPKKRKITARDVEFSFLRIADERVHSSGYWLIRNKIKGIGEFRKKSGELKDGDYSIYEVGCPGIKVIDDQNLVIELSKPDPRFLYGLAMPYMSIVAREAVEAYGEDFSEHPVGSGPFILKEWQRNYKIEFVRNPNFRTELFPEADDPKDKNRKLPFLDRVVAYQIAQPLSSWLMFLKGDIDLSALDKDNFDAVVTDDMKLIPSLEKRGIEMLRIPKFQIYYIGFCFTDPVIADNVKLRQAISLAYDVQKRVKIFNHSVLPAQGPIPHGVAGNNPEFKNPYAQYDLAKAEKLLAEAGYPRGIDPKTGQNLELTLDLGGTSSNYRQIAELFAEDMQKIGIKIKPVLNNWPRFLQKSAKGDMQLYKVSWIGDYPDAENFLQLFYGPNAGSCNRSHYRDKKFDKLFEEIMPMNDSPERTAKYEKMVQYLSEQCPWIFAYYPISFRLRHSWVENYTPHDFGFNRWKYLAIDKAQRIRMKKSFQPIDLDELRN